MPKTPKSASSTKLTAAQTAWEALKATSALQRRLMRVDRLLALWQGYQDNGGNSLAVIYAGECVSYYSREQKRLQKSIARSLASVSQNA
jgi:hypothetical protein